MEIQNKVAVVTGAGSGIGRALAKQLAKKGATVIINDFNEETLAETAQMIQKKGNKCSSYPFDVSNRAAVYNFAENVLSEHGPVDIVINNAGVALGRYSVLEVDYEDFEWVMGINFWGVVYGTKAFLPHLLKRPAASIVNISSVFGLAGIAEQAPYCSTKFAVRGFTESLRMELLEYPNITVTSVHPGGIKTNIVLNGRAQDEATKEKTNKIFQKKLTRTTASAAAKKIIKGITKNKSRVLIGPDATIMDRIIRLFPVRYTKLFATQLAKAQE